MKKNIVVFVCALVLAVSILVLGVLVSKKDAENREQTRKVEETVKQAAIRDLALPADTQAELSFVGTSNVPWLEYDIYVYRLSVGKKVYIVSAQIKGFEVHYVDVEGEIDDKA